MPISFTPAERLAITRRQIRIDLENAGFTTSINSFNSQQVQLLAVDGSNTKFYGYYNDIAQAYEAEARLWNGLIPDTYLNGDIDAAAQNPTIDPFFPSSPLPAYVRNIPLILDGTHTNNKVKGYFHTTGTDARYEQNILTNTSVYDGLTEMIFRLSNGITGGTNSTTTTTTSIPSGVIVSLTLSVVSSTGFAATELLYINNGAASGIYKIISTTGGITPTITVSSVVHSLTGISTGTIKNTVVAFTGTERQNLTSATYQEILTNITNRINALITEWEGKIDSQIALVNGDDRSPQNTQITAALADVANTKVIIDAWQALSNTGVSGKYVAASIAPISAEITARQTFMGTRITQITTALGGTSLDALFQTGATYGTNSPNNPYFNRYKWLNFRINRASGSLRRYYSANQAKDAVTQLLADNTTIKGEYDSYFLTKAVVFNDGSDILHLKDLTGLSNGNLLTVVSETQPEISRTIVQTMGTTQVKLDAPVPTTYKTEDIARVFKTL